MAKQGRLLPARKPREDESLLLRSAETLGRMIGSLQRQLDDATRRLSGNDGNGAAKGFRMTPDGDGRRAQATTKPGSKSGATKIRSTADRKSKRASKSAAAKKTTGRTRSGASRRARKASRST